MSTTLGELLPWRLAGDRAGRCVACGMDTTSGTPAQLPDTFTTAYKLYAGSVLCPHCAPLFREKSLRTHSWMASQAEFLYLGRTEWLTALLEPPEPPFAIYLTLGRQKYGFLPLIRRVSTSRERYWLGTDWNESALLICRERLIDFLSLAKQLREHGVPKAQMLSAQFAPTTVAKALKEGWKALLGDAEQLRGDPHWEVMVYAVE